jgi:CBS domain containing-hemolysin-like protein
MDRLSSMTGLAPEGYKWVWVGVLFLILGMAVSTSRRMLSRFSRKGLLEELPERERERLEELLPRLGDYEAALRAIDQGLRLGLVASLAFAALKHGAQGAEAHEEVFSFLALLGVLVGVLVLFLELVPSVLARVRTESAVRRILPLLDRVHRAVEPIGRLYASVVRFGARIVGGQVERNNAAVVEEEILTAVEEGEREGLLRKGEISMIESIIRFRDREVSEVMTPRTEMVCLDIEERIQRSVPVAIECGHSRIPVYRENKDNIAGILYVKDLLRFWGRPKSEEVKLCDLIRQAHFVPESKKISELFHEFRSQRFHIAIILDEFGGTAGLITIEDIIEEIVGEIADEFEKVERPEFQKLGEDLVEVDARLPIHDLNEKLQVELPEDDGYDTVGGFLFSAMGKIPRVGDSFDYGRIHFEVLEADERKINRLRLRLGSATPPAPAPAESVSSPAGAGGEGRHAEEAEGAGKGR